jgi:hypothetical protein
VARLLPPSDLPLVLRPFDQVTAPPGAALRAEGVRAGARLSLRWRLDAPPGSVTVAARSAEPSRRDRLWESTCFEAFIGPAGRPDYWEVNLSPSGDWNFYRFDGERTGMRPEPRVMAPSVETTSHAGGRVTVTAALDLAPLAELAAAPLDLSITAVLESASGVRSYWALRHTSPRPDFHARGSFVIRLP